MYIHSNRNFNVEPKSKINPCYFLTFCNKRYIHVANRWRSVSYVYIDLKTEVSLFSDTYRFLAMELRRNLTFISQQSLLCENMTEKLNEMPSGWEMTHMMCSVKRSYVVRKRLCSILQAYHTQFVTMVFVQKLTSSVYRWPDVLTFFDIQWDSLTGPPPPPLALRSTTYSPS
jgi:hypothetical protein